jgi:2-dehydro-3-deoxygluconokinase
LKAVTFGEIMLRLAAPGYSRFEQADSFTATYGGAEANVAASLAQFGLETYFVTKVPDNPIGRAAVNQLRRYGIKDDYIIRGGSRLGIYFLETGASQRPSQVIYDRERSAMAEARPEEFKWREIFAGAAWFHVTGITPALSDSAAAAVLEACRTAREAGVTVSCDLNYRKKLWPREKAGAVMAEIMPYVDVAVANEEDAANVFGIEAPAAGVEQGVLDEEGYGEVARRLQERFQLKYVGITLRESYSASENGWSGLIFDGSGAYLSRKYRIHVVDRVGAGDSFAAGLIYGLLQRWEPRAVIEFAAAASCLKHTVPGDFNLATVEEVRRLASGDASGRVQR